MLKINSTYSTSNIIVMFSLLAVCSSLKFSVSGNITCTRKHDFVVDLELWEDDSLSSSPLFNMKVRGPGENVKVPYTIDAEASEGAKLKIQITHMCFEDETSLGQEIEAIGVVSSDNLNIERINFNLDNTKPQDTQSY